MAPLPVPARAREKQFFTGCDSSGPPIFFFFFFSLYVGFTSSPQAGFKTAPLQFSLCSFPSSCRAYSARNNTNKNSLLVAFLMPGWIYLLAFFFFHFDMPTLPPNPLTHFPTSSVLVKLSPDCRFLKHVFFMFKIFLFWNLDFIINCRLSFLF